MVQGREWKRQQGGGPRRAAMNAVVYDGPAWPVEIDEDSKHESQTGNDKKGGDMWPRPHPSPERRIEMPAESETLGTNGHSSGAEERDAEMAGPEEMEWNGRG
ncbi:hypothetical protein VFPFJ_06578 [Purpureocillium lilacinum]|uniref:Uncharacterized protein n=1 Tax=Purpureocillium lilacinum TaxID=33203 RepID=A0A179HF42_PURLI|nr:hypothetical protein VFPFJ_06578 [Purpureocillium lilacinum]OAQ88113.1 hypothetical protein VFPFJ_06578 [Purpureocillium lilacinum]